MMASREKHTYLWGILLMVVALLTTACQTNSAGAVTAMLNGAGDGDAGNGDSRFSGVIEGSQVSLVAEVGGRVAELSVDEGDRVEAGQVLLRLDDAAMQAQIKQAQAGVSAAQAALAQVKAGTRSEEIAAAQAALAQAEAERDGAAQAHQDVLALIEDPQQLQAQLDATRTGIKLAEQNVAAAQVGLDEAHWWREFHDDDPGQRESLDKKVAIAQRELEAAQAQLNGAKAQSGALGAMLNAPVTLQAEANTALNAYSMTLANVGVAQASLAELEAGARSEEIALAEARLHQAQAQLKLAQAYLSRAALRAPIEGIVASRSVHAGETIQAGLALMTIINLDEVNLLVYVPQTSLPRVALGAPVQVYVDAYPYQVFEGKVASIANQAQFSSRDTQSREDRANVVFAVKVRLANPDHRLKAGMTADAVIQMQ